MSTLRQELTFEGGVNVEIDPHLLKLNEWQKLQNLWPYRNKLIGTRPSLVYESDILPVPSNFWNSRLFNGFTDYPTNVKNYGQWFRHLTPLRAIFLGNLDRLALICVCNQDNMVTINEHFEGENANEVMLMTGDVILMLTPNDLLDGGGTSVYPIISAVRLGQFSNLTPSLIEFNGDVIAANKGCTYVVRVVKSSTLPAPSTTTWPGIDYRYTKINFGPTNTDFRADGVIVYKNRFVYWKANKVWFSDPFNPAAIYDDAVATAFLGIFFDTGLTEEITAMADLYTSSLEEAGSSVLAVWTAHSMLIVQGEPATTIASTPEELFANCKVTRVPLTAGCISQASIVKTKYGLIWCGAESVWLMPRGNLPIEVGRKISPRIQAQSFESAGRVFATFDDECYRLVINAPNVGFNAYTALNEMWCLSFNGGIPSKESAAWYGPQIFTNTDNPQISNVPAPAGESGVFCCAKLTNINDDRTWYIQPYTYFLGFNDDLSNDQWGTRLGLSSITHYLGVDITAPFRPEACVNSAYFYSVGAIYQSAIGDPAALYGYYIDFVVVTEGLPIDGLAIPIFANDIGTAQAAKRTLIAFQESTDEFPLPYTIELQSGNMTLGAPELLKLIDGYEFTFKTLNPIALQSWWWPWEPNDLTANVVVFESKVKLFASTQNVLDNFFSEPVLTARRVPAPITKRYNGLTAQLNINEPSTHRIIAANGVNNPNWNKIKISTDGIDWSEFNLFDFDAITGIANYETITELITLLIDKTFTALGRTLQFQITDLGYELRFSGGTTSLYIDLTAQGWEWFGYIPTGIDLGFGSNIISNVNDSVLFVKPTGPVPLYTPHVIHIAKLAPRYKIFGARPR